MKNTLVAIAVLTGLAISVLVMGVLFAVNVGGHNASYYISIGLIVGLFSGLSIYRLMDQIK